MNTAIKYWEILVHKKRLMASQEGHNFMEIVSYTGMRTSEYLLKLRWIVVKIILKQRIFVFLNIDLCSVPLFGVVLDIYTRCSGYCV
jgi:hypothetical protein